MWTKHKTWPLPCSARLSTRDSGIRVSNATLPSGAIFVRGGPGVTVELLGSISKFQIKSLIPRRVHFGPSLPRSSVSILEISTRAMMHLCQSIDMKCGAPATENQGRNIENQNQLAKGFLPRPENEETEMDEGAQALHQRLGELIHQGPFPNTKALCLRRTYESDNVTYVRFWDITISLNVSPDEEDLQIFSNVIKHDANLSANLMHKHQHFPHYLLSNLFRTPFSRSFDMVTVSMLLLRALPEHWISELLTCTINGCHQPWQKRTAWVRVSWWEDSPRSGWSQLSYVGICFLHKWRAAFERRKERTEALPRPSNYPTFLMTKTCLQVLPSPPPRESNGSAIVLFSTLLKTKAGTCHSISVYGFAARSQILHQMPPSLRRKIGDKNIENAGTHSASFLCWIHLWRPSRIDNRILSIGRQRRRTVDRRWTTGLPNLQEQSGNMRTYSHSVPYNRCYPMDQRTYSRDSKPQENCKIRWLLQCYFDYMVLMPVCMLLISVYTRRRRNLCLFVSSFCTVVASSTYMYYNLL